MPSPKRILALSASVGAGHDRAAQALVETALEMGGGIRAEWMDALRFTSGPFRRAYAGSYLHMANRAPGLWGLLYRSTNKPPRGATRRALRAIDRAGYRKLVEAVRRRRPDAIVCTHFLPANVVLASGIGRAVPVHVVVTDFDAHAQWVVPGAAGYFVASDEVKAILRGFGVAEERIRVTGIPVSPLFARRRPAEKIRREVGLNGGGRPVVLVMGGGFGLDAVETAARRLSALDATLLVVAGRNGRLRERLAGLPGGIRVFGRVSNVHDLMQVSDLIVTKAGGLTVSESLARRLPMVLANPTPGQEERNADHLLEAGAAVRADSPEVLELKVRALLGDPRRRAEMRRRAGALARPRAAREILKRVLES
jgi:processive 1,2-diacylglycerol beta-glucosyltransferase